MLKYVPSSLGLVWKTTEAPCLETCQNMGFRREEVWALLADESPWGERRPASPQAMVADVATQLRKMESLIAPSHLSPDCCFDGRMFLIHVGSQNPRGALPEGNQR